MPKADMPDTALKGGPANRKADTIDTHVGLQMKRRRLFLGHSQQYIAAKLGISYQQIQKYENGTSRLSAGRLYLIALILQAPLSYFFKDLHNVQAILTDKDSSGYRGMDPAELNSLESAPVKEAIIDLIEAINRSDCC